MSTVGDVGFDYFKSNITSVEEAAAADNSDIANVTKYMTWVQWVQGYQQSAHFEYLMNTSLPKTARSLLKRSYSNEVHAEAAAQHLKHILSICVEFMHLPALASLLSVLLDYRQPFYARYGFPKVKTTVSTKRKLKTVSWRDRLNVGDCVDICLNNVWEIAPIEQINKNIPEPELLLCSQSGDRWVKLADENIARYGTKTGLYSSEEIKIMEDEDRNDAAGGSATPTSESSQVVGQDSSGIPSTDFLQSLRIGLLIDAQDKAGVWNQACVMEIRRVEISSPEESVSTTPLKSGVEALSVQDETPTDQIETPGEVVHIDPEPPGASASLTIDRGNNHHLVFLRVAFIGFSEHSDEWIDITSDCNKVRTLNSMSGGKRGEALIRDEVVFVAVNHSIETDTEDALFGIRAHNSLFSPFYIDITKEFGAMRGTERINVLFNGPQSPLHLETALHLMVAYGELCVVLKKIPLSLADNQDPSALMIRSFLNRLRLLTLQEMREASTDLLEKAISAMEDIIIFYFGRTEKAGLAVDVYLFKEIALKYIFCPFLNRRLWGLKHISDFVRKCRMLQEFPDGIRVSRTYAAVATTAASNSAHLESAVSYRIVRLAYGSSASSLCDWLNSNGILSAMFNGDFAHSSLMQRTSEILRFLAVNRALTPQLLGVIWDTGFSSREPVALQVLAEVIEVMDMNSITQLLFYAKSASKEMVTSSIVDLVAAISNRVHLSVLHPMGDSVVRVSDEESSEQRNQADDVFVRSLQTLWEWAKDDSGVPDACASKCVQRLESLISTGMENDIALQKMGKFQWGRHWMRINVILSEALGELRRSCSISPSISVLRWCLTCFPPKTASGMDELACHQPDLPFEFALRFKAAEYLESEFGVMNMFSETIVQLKQKFSTTVSGISSSFDSSAGDSISQLSGTRWTTYNFNSEVQGALNDAVIGASRIGYKTTLEQCFNFMIFFARCSLKDSMKIPYNVVEKIWLTVLKDAATTQERDLVVFFISRLVLFNKGGGNQQFASSGGNEGAKAGPQTAEYLQNDIANIMNSGAMSDSKGERRLLTSLMTRENVIRTFQLLFYDVDFIRSVQLSTKAFECIETYFRWINADFGNIVIEAAGFDGGRFVSNKNLSELFGWGVFLQVILRCVDPVVAQLAIKCLTSFVNKFSFALVQSGEVGRHYGSLIELSMNMLGKLHAEYIHEAVMVDGMDSTPTLLRGTSVETLFGDIMESGLNRELLLQRLLMLLGGILDESATDSGRHDISSHDSRIRSEPIHIKINATGKNKFIQVTSVTMRVTDRLADLVQKIEDNLIPGMTYADIKIFHSGKELILNSNRMKILKDLNFKTSDSIMLTERPKQNNAAPSTVGTAIDNTDAKSLLADLSTDSKEAIQTSVSTAFYTLPREMLPAIQLSTTEAYFELLFTMLEYSSGEFTNSLWSLIMRLPTSHVFLSRWTTIGNNLEREQEQESIKGLLGIISSSSNINGGGSSNIKMELAEDDGVLILSAGGTEDRLSIPRLVYSVQIIENLMNDTIISMGNTESGRLTSNWVSSFVSRGGIVALVSAFSLTVKRMNEYLLQNSAALSVYNGISSVMLLQALSGLTKLLRAFFTLFNVASSPDDCSLEIILKNSQRRNSALLGITEFLPVVKSTMSAGTSNKDAYDLTVSDIFPEESSEVKKVEMKEQNAAVLVLDSSVERSILNTEWGLQYLRAVEGFILPPDLLLHSQAIVVDCIRILKMFSFEKNSSHTSLNSPVESSSSSTTSSTSGLTSEVYICSALENLLVMWGSTVSLRPEIILELPAAAREGVFWNSSLTSLLKNIASSEIDRGYKTSALTDRIVSWLVQSISDILSLLQNSSTNVYIEFSSRILSLALNMRPQIINSISVGSASGISVDLEFSFLCSMLELSDKLTEEILTIERRSTLVKEIVTELRVASKTLAGINSHYVNGTMCVLNALIGQRRQILQMLQDDGVLVFLIEDCLGITDAESVKLVVLCQDETSKKSAYTILLNFCLLNAETAEMVLSLFRASHQDAILALHKLDNPAPISGNLIPTAAKPKDLILTTFRPERDIRSTIGYAGIRNLGCTCYMNSLLEILFMIPEVRSGILQFPVNVNVLSDDEKSDNLFLQLQRMFLHLVSTQRKAYSPETWARAYKDENGVLPINVAQQQDAQEFLQVLCERLENYMIIKPYHTIGTLTHSNLKSKDSPDQLIEVREELSSSSLQVDGPTSPVLHSISDDKSAISSDEVKMEFDDLETNNLTPVPMESIERKVNIMQAAFGGKLADQMVLVKDDGSTLTPEDVREKEETFFCISLDVLGTAGLESSLSKYVSGETINDFRWSEDAPRVSIIKRQLISELSNTVIFHLKRFELNFDTFRREKVNDEFQFPQYLDLFPYSKEKHVGSLSAGQQKTSSYYQYELQGIVVHTGTTDAGHYFSYIRETDELRTGDSLRWIEFNDSEVSLFSESRIPKECFGGFTKTFEIGAAMKDNVAKVTANPKSAYMLVYRRVHPIDTDLGLVETGTAISGASGHGSDHILGDTYKRTLRHEIEVDNRNHMICSRIFSSPHLQFMANFFELLRKYNSLKNFIAVAEGQRSSILREFISTGTKILSRTTHYSIYTSYCDQLIAFFSNQSTAHIGTTAEELAKKSSDTNTVLSDSIVFGQVISVSHNKENQAPQGNGDDEEEAMALSLSLSKGVTSRNDEIRLNDTNYACPSNQSLPELSREEILNLANETMQYFLADFDCSFGLLFAPEASVRTATAKILFRVFEILAVCLDPNILNLLPHEVWKDGVVSSTQICIPSDFTPKPDSMDVINIYNVNHNTLAQPAARIMSEAQAISMTTFLSDVSNPCYTAVKFLIEITKDSRLQTISENWRRSDAICWLIWRVCNAELTSRLILVQRELIIGICDIFLGDRSVTGGEYFVQGIRKRATSSYTTLPVTKPDVISNAAKNIPDWSALLETLAVLTSICKTDPMVIRPHLPPPTMSCSWQYCMQWDELSRKSLMSKTLFATLLQQQRYVVPTIMIMRHLCYENRLFSQEISEAIMERLSSCNAEHVFYIFEFLDAFLSIRDNLSPERLDMLFTGPYTLLDMIRQSQESKALFSIVCIKSLICLANRVVTFFNLLRNRLNTWAIWMLKFTYQYQSKLIIEAESISLLSAKPVVTTSTESTTSSTSLTKGDSPKGSYFILYGESEADRELPTVKRAERCFQELRELILKMGSNPDILMPDDAFIDIQPDDAIIGAAFDLSSTDAIIESEDVQAPKSEYMTDEELARWLATQN